MSEKRRRGRPSGVPNPNAGRRPLKESFDEPLVTLAPMEVPASYKQYLIDKFGGIAKGIRSLIEYHQESETTKMAINRKVDKGK